MRICQPQALTTLALGMSRPASFQESRLDSMPPWRTMRSKCSASPVNIAILAGASMLVRMASRRRFVVLMGCLAFLVSAIWRWGKKNGRRTDVCCPACECVRLIKQWSDAADVPRGRQVKAAHAVGIPHDPLRGTVAMQLAHKGVIGILLAAIHACADEPLIDGCVGATGGS